MDAIPWWVFAALGVALIVGVAWYRSRSSGNGTGGGSSGGGSGARPDKE